MKAQGGSSGGRSRSGSKSGSGASFMTVASFYKDQLNDLMSTLRSTSPHFIRCIIPNLKKTPGEIDAKLCLEQLRCNGVLEGIRISRMGFPNRIKYAEFVQRFYLLHPTMKRNDPNPREATESIMKLSKVDAEEFRYGVTKIFFRHGIL